MKKFEKKTNKYYCPDCTKNCRNKQNKKISNCNKYKNDELYSVKKMSDSDLIIWLVN